MIFLCRAVPADLLGLNINSSGFHVSWKPRIFKRSNNEGTSERSKEGYKIRWLTVARNLSRNTGVAVPIQALGPARPLRSDQSGFWQKNAFGRQIEEYRYGVVYAVCSKRTPKEKLPWSLLLVHACGGRFVRTATNTRACPKCWIPARRGTAGRVVIPKWRIIMYTYNTPAPLSGVYRKKKKSKNKRDGGGRRQDVSLTRWIPERN